MDSPSATNPLKRVWLAATLLLFIPAALQWRQYTVAPPTTPIDLGQPQYAQYWRFLSSARRVVPRGSSYTIKGPDLTAEMELYMLSVGLFTGAKPYPASYLWAPQAGGGAEAQHILVYGNCVCPPDAKTMRPVEGGCVCSR